MTTFPPSPADPSLAAKVGIVMSLGLRPGERRATAGAVVTGKLSDRPSDSDGRLLLGAGCVKRHSVDAFPQCLYSTLSPLSFTLLCFLSISRRGRTLTRLSFAFLRFSER